MGKKQAIAIDIALQTQVLKSCPIHNQLYCDDEEYCEEKNDNMARAFAAAIELVRQHAPSAVEFHHNAHELTDLLSLTIGAAPMRCPECAQRGTAYPSNAGAAAPLGPINELISAHSSGVCDFP